MLKTRTWILIIALILALSIGASGFLYLRKSPGSVARISRDGQVIQEIDLSGVTEPYSFTLTDPQGGSNTVSVEPGRIAITSADCPDQVCVRHGWIAVSGDPIVCLPHRLTIQIAPGGNAEEFDTTAG